MGLTYLTCRHAAVPVQCVLAMAHRHLVKYLDTGHLDLGRV